MPEKDNVLPLERKELVELSNGDFLRAVFQDLEDGAYPLICHFKDDPRSDDRGKWSARPAKIERQDLHYKRPSENTYFTVSAFVQNERGRYTRSKATFSSLHVLTLDDIGTGKSAKINPAQIRLAPSYVLETSPANFQVGYILDVPETDQSRANALIDAMVHQGLAADNDPGMKGVTRYVRLPVGANTKKEYGEPFKHRLHQWHPDRRYSIEAIIEAFDLDLEPFLTAPEGDPAASWPADPDADPYLQVFKHLGWVGEDVSPKSDGWVPLDYCPFTLPIEGICEGHSKAADTQGAAYKLGGGFRCHHGHCQDLAFPDVKRRLALEGLDLKQADAAQRDAYQSAAGQAMAGILSEADLAIAQGFAKGVQTAPAAKASQRRSQRQDEAFQDEPWTFHDLDLPEVLASQLPQIPFVLGSWTAEGQLTGVAGYPNVGKTRLMINMAFSVACARRDLLNVDVHRSGGAMIVSNEERLDDFRRRCKATALHFGLTGTKHTVTLMPADSTKRLVAYDPQEREVKTNDALVDAIVEKALAIQAKLICFDPLVTMSANMDENSNSMIELTSLLRTIAQRTQAAVLFFHHTPKSQGKADDWYRADLEAMRGAGAIGGAIDFCMTLSRHVIKTADGKAVKHPFGVGNIQNKRWVILDSNAKVREGDGGYVQLFHMHSEALPEGFNIGVASPRTLADMQTAIQNHTLVDAVNSSPAALILANMAPGIYTASDIIKAMKDVDGWPVKHSKGKYVEAVEQAIGKGVTLGDKSISKVSTTPSTNLKKVAWRVSDKSL